MPCFAISPCAATTASASATAVFWICPSALPRETTSAPYAITKSDTAGSLWDGMQ
ncbi:secreted protein [gut metagenome]|uniref:Secreted protein n=1 Tax=gut metagenome TaxID=749906 RepID=J9FR93_9ZZZZ